MNVTKHTSLFLGIVLFYLNINGSVLLHFEKQKQNAFLLCMGALQYV